MTRSTGPNRFSRSFDGDRLEGRIRSQEETITRMLGRTAIAAGVGFLVGAAAGVYVGESLNDYIPVLREAPPALQYAVDAGTAFVCGSVGSGVFGVVSQFYGFMRVTRR